MKELIRVPSSGFTWQSRVSLLSIHGVFIDLGKNPTLRIGDRFEAVDLF